MKKNKLINGILFIALFSIFAFTLFYEGVSPFIQSLSYLAMASIWLGMMSIEAKDLEDYKIPKMILKILIAVTAVTWILFLFSIVENFRFFQGISVIMGLYGMYWQIKISSWIVHTPDDAKNSNNTDYANNTNN